MNYETVEGTTITIPVDEGFFIDKTGLYYKDIMISHIVPVIEKQHICVSDGKYDRSYSVKLLQDGNIIDQGRVPDLDFNRWHLYLSGWMEKAIPRGHVAAFDMFLRGQLLSAKKVNTMKVDEYGWKLSGEGIIYSGAVSFKMNIGKEILFGTGCSRVIDVAQYKFDTSAVNQHLNQLNEMYPPHFISLYYLSLAAPLKRTFANMGVPFVGIPNVVGFTASGKSSSVRSLCNPIYETTFSTTENKRTVVKEISRCSANTVLLDDYHPHNESYSSKRQTEIKDTIVRLTEDNPDMPVVIMTSEFQDGELSLQNREILILFEEAVKKEHLKVLESMKPILNEIRNAFIVALIRNEKTAKKIVGDFFGEETLEDECTTTSGRRIMRNYSYLLCIDKLFKTLMQEVYKCEISISGYRESLLKMESIHQSCMETLEQQNRYRTHLIALRNMLNSNDYLSSISNQKHYTGDKSLKYFDGEYIYLTREALKYGMGKYYGYLNYKVDDIVRELDEADLLHKYSSGNERTEKVNGHRVYRIYWDGLVRFCEDFSL